jgi:hypothetical protein
MYPAFNKQQALQAISALFEFALNIENEFEKNHMSIQYIATNYNKIRNEYKNKQKLSPINNWNSK